MATIKRCTELLVILLFSMTCHAQQESIKLGDIININGVKGIVFKVNSDGTHGSIMSVKSFRGRKDLFCNKKSLLKSVSLNNTECGKCNTDEVFLKFDDAENLSHFPAFQWCRSLGEGWYIPTETELRAFINFWIGNVEQEMSSDEWDEWGDDDAKNSEDGLSRKKVNAILMDAGGIPFINGVFTSTVDEYGKVSVFSFDKERETFRLEKIDAMKLDKFTSCRAFYDF